MLKGASTKIIACILAANLLILPSMAIAQSADSSGDAFNVDKYSATATPGDSTTAAPDAGASQSDQQAAPSASATVVGEGSKDDYIQGKMDAEQDYRDQPVWILAGLAGTGLCLLIGCAGILVAFVAAPSPPADRLLGKSTNYILGYTEAYKHKGKRANAKWATIGCTLAAVINLIINIASGNFPPDTGM
jgi:hypothetical protein